jgi:hypothetical protein
MVAALLPIPEKPVISMIETPNANISTSHVDLSSESAHGLQTMDEIRYRSARWWRNLNRVMSVVGVLVIGAIIALVIVGVREQWA